MSIEAAIYYEAQSSAGITTEVGTRVYQATMVEQETDMPYLTIQRVSGVREDQQGGDGLVDARYQFTCVGATPEDALDLAAAVITEFKHYRGAMGEAGSTVNVRDAQIEDDRWLPIAPTDGSEWGPQGYVVDVRVFYVP